MNNKVILVTGGTGSWGYELVNQLLDKKPKEVRIFSRNESSQFKMKQSFNHHPSLTFVIGDVRDKEALVSAMKDVDIVYHLAALKHVPICEIQPNEALKTNVEGTNNVVEAAVQNNVQKVIYVSTDKAANPSNFYGMTKALGEKLIINANLLSNNTQFMCVRGGNILGSNGSVIHVFKEQIKAYNEIRLTHKKMSRFFLTLHDAISLLLKATDEGLGGEIFVMKMPSCLIHNIAELLIEDSDREDVKIIETGIRLGEKIDEILLTEVESMSTIRFDGDYHIILPQIAPSSVLRHYENYPKAELLSYSSRNNLMTKDEVKKMLQKGGFIS